MDKSSPENTEKPEEYKQILKKIRSKDGRLRPKSASKYIGILSDYTQTCQSNKRHSNPSVIEKILKRSMKKAKIQKSALKKDSKLKTLRTEIRKNELEYQNKKIRLNNSLSMRNKRTKSREKSQKSTENPALATMKTENSPQYRKKDPLFLTTSKKPKKNLIPSKKPKNLSIIEYMKKKKSQRSKQEYQEKLKENAKKFVKAQNLQKLERFIINSFRKSHENSLSSIESDPYAIDQSKSGTFHDVNRNISFIYEDGSEKSFSKENEFSLDKGITGKTYEIEYKFTETQDDDRKSTDLVYKTRDNFEKMIKSPEFRTIKFNFPTAFDIELQENVTILNKKPKILNTVATTGLSISPYNRSMMTCTQSLFSISPTMPLKKNSSTQSSSFSAICPESSLSIKGKSKKVLKNSSLSSISIKPVRTLESLEQYSWNLALIFLIDQLHLYEISDLTENFPSVTSKILKKIGKKYVQVKTFIQNALEKLSFELLETLSFEQHTKFIQQTHDKKIGIQKILTEAFEESLESSESDRDSITGISHSHSLQFLHEENPEKKDKTPEVIVSFGFESNENKESPCVISISDGDSSAIIMDSAELTAFIADVFKLLNWENIMKELDKPLYKNPLQELDKLQETQIGSVTETEITNFPWLFNVNTVLQSFEDNEHLENYEKTHRKMILHVLNFLLQQFRPFGYKGFPLPWSHVSTFHYGSYKLQDVKEKIISDVQILNSLNIGSIVEVDPFMKKPSEQELVKMKVSQLDKIIFFEALMEDEKWINYEFEIAQVNIDVADIILQDLAVELIKCVDC